MADLICRWRNGTPQNVVEVVNSMPHHEMPEWQFKECISICLTACTLLHL